ncbi:MAG: hypothetical protein HQL45_13235 [Alphaproteobacteria bacterium]|nr:hypothetical protein [Alphaproteobacteria bacterium]
MSASRNNLILLAFLGFLVLPVSQALAEAAETVSENKETDVIIPEPVPLVGGVQGARRDIGGVQAQELKPVSRETVGTLDAAHGGLSVDMWQGTPREVVETWLPQLPAAPGALTPYDLQRRLLLTSAEVPQGLPGVGEKDTASLLIRRIERLFAMGAGADARGMLDLVPANLRAESLIRYEIESWLLEGDDKKACGLADPHLSKGDDVFWAKAALFCALVEGDKAHAGLSLDLMRESKVPDPYFFYLAETALGAKIKTAPKLEEPQALHLAMLRLSKKGLPEGLADRLTQPTLLKAVLGMGAASAENRLLAARKAEAAGALPAGEVRRLYEAIELSEKELADALALAEKDKGQRGRVLYYRWAKQQTDANARAEAIVKGLGVAGKGNALLATMRLYAPLVEELPPSPQLAWFAPTALRVLLTAGLPQMAKSWSEIAKPQGQGQVQNQAGEVLLLPLLRLAGQSPALELVHLQSWREAQKEAPPERATLLFGLLEALGDPVPSQLWLAEAGAKAEAASVPPVLWHGLKQAAQGKSSGQAALFSLLALGEAGPGGASPLVMQEVVRTLKAAGLEKDARSLALEAAIAAGI